MRILNYGAGAVGLGIDSCLLKAGKQPDMIARPQTINALKENGLIRTGIFGEFKASANSFSCYGSLAQLPAKAYDYILVSTKSFDSPSTAKDIHEHPFIFNEKTKIILCQNGWGNAETFCSLFSRDQIYNARVITGFTRSKPNQVNITVHADDILIGSLFGSNLKEIGPLCEAITQGGIPCKISEDIGKDLWAKMLYNCALNSLGAILDVPYGELGKHAYTRKLMARMVEEIFDVLQAAGYTTHWPNAQEYLEAFYTKFLPPTAKHRSSTLQDIKAKKRTEIDALNGIVLKMAEQLKIEVPFNQNAYRIVKSIEEKNLAEK